LCFLFDLAQEKLINLAHETKIQKKKTVQNRGEETAKLENG
jgi:hypothetical protein